jgi:hypothetical protein
MLAYVVIGGLWSSAMYLHVASQPSADAGKTFALTAGQHLVRFQMEVTGNVKVVEYVSNRFSTLRYRDRIGARKLRARLVKRGYRRF